MKIYTLAVFAASALLAAAPAAATTITFDGVLPVNGVSTTLGNTGYFGLSWTNFGVLRPSSVPGLANTGYGKGVVSGTSIAFNENGSPAGISAAGTFTLNSSYFTAAWIDGVSVTATGFNSATQLYSTSFLINKTGPTLVTFDWTNLTRVTFTPSSTTNFALDDLRINEALSVAPEPVNWAMFVTGFGMAGAALRRRRTRIRFA